MSRCAGKIAERLVAATQRAALLTTFNEVEHEPVISSAKQHPRKVRRAHGIKLGFMSFSPNRRPRGYRPSGGQRSISRQRNRDAALYDIGVPWHRPKA